MANYSELQNPSGEDTHQEDDTNAQENFAMYDPGPQETTDENWESWHGDEVSFSRTQTDDEHGICCNGYTCGDRIKARPYFYLIVLCSSFFLCILAAVLTSVIFGVMNVRSSPNDDGTYWYESAVGYQIFPRSFQDSDGDGVGDFKGIIHRLDYLQYLGVDVIWLCTINPSPYTDIGLDITNYTAVDPVLGDLEDFQKLVKAAHNKDIKLVLEFVPNHSSKDHNWFRQSRQSRTNLYGDFYIWADGTSEGEPPNDWKDASGHSSWVYEPLRQQWYHHSFLDTEPSLNYDNKLIQIAMSDALRFWFEQGIDGVYIRNANHLLGTSEIEADRTELNDYTGSNDTRAKRNRRAADSGSMGSSYRAGLIIEKWRTVLKEFESSKNDKKLLVVDTYTSPVTFTRTMYGTKDRPLADYPFNYALFYIGKRKITGHTVRYLVESWLVYRPKSAPTNWAFGSPEISRLATRYEPRFQGAVTLLMLTLPGSPLLYYGDEIGMIDAMVSDSLERMPYAPMQWDSSVRTGFTEGNETWIDLANNSLTNNVKVQQENESSLLNMVRNMIKLRHAEPSLNDPNEEIHLYNLHSMRELVVFVRHHQKGNFPDFLFVANLANYEVTEDYTLLVTSVKLPETGTVILGTNNTLIGETVDFKALRLFSGEAVIVKFESLEQSLSL